MRWWRDLVAATRSADPLRAATNRIALFVGSSQPLYPLGLVWILGEAGWAAAIAWLTTPFFLAVPFIARRRPAMAKALLSGAGSFVTVAVALRLGPASWVEFYHLPVILIGLLLFRSKEWLARGVTLALPLAGLALVHFAGLAPSGVEGVEKVQLVHGLGALGLSIYVAYEAWMARGARSHQTPV